MVKNIVLGIDIIHQREGAGVFMKFFFLFCFVFCFCFCLALAKEKECVTKWCTENPREKS